MSTKLLGYSMYPRPELTDIIEALYTVTQSLGHTYANLDDTNGCSQSKALSEKVLLYRFAERVPRTWNRCPTRQLKVRSHSR